MNTLTGIILFAVILVIMLAMMLPLYARAVTFTPPVHCLIGTDCFIQNYVDLDSGEGSEDYRCGNLTYDGHKGTDFRLRDIAAMYDGVNVVAAAKGTVKAVRDGMADQLMSRKDQSNIASRECGNGVVIEHSSGFETQYCHLMKDSIIVHEGQSLGRGDVLGKIGLSGKTEFPHVHFSVRQDGRVIDPFIGPVDEANCGEDGKNLWHYSMRDGLHYETGVLLNMHFSDAAPDPTQAREGNFRMPNLRSDAPALVVWSDTMAALAGDIITLQINAPDNQLFAEHSITVKRPKAQQFLFAGKRRPKEGWLKGEYRGTYTLKRAGETIDTNQIVIQSF